MRKFTIQESRRLAFAISVNSIFFNKNIEFKDKETGQINPNFNRIQIRLDATDNPFFPLTLNTKIDRNIFSSNNSILKEIQPYNVPNQKNDNYQSRFNDLKYSRTFKKGSDNFLRRFSNRELLDISDVLIFLLFDLPTDVIDEIIRLIYNDWKTNRIAIKSTRTLLSVLFQTKRPITNDEKQDIIEIFSGFLNALFDNVIEVNTNLQRKLPSNDVNLIKITALLKLSRSLEYDFSNHLSKTSMKSYPFAHYKEFPYIASAMIIYNDWINIPVRDIQSFGIIIHALNQVIEEHDNLDGLFNPLANSKFNSNNWDPIFEFLHDGIKERYHQELLQSQKNEDITSTYIHMEWSFPSEIFTPFVSTLTFSSIDQVTSLFEFLRNNQLLNGMADYAIQFMVDKQIEKKSH
jgi:hypothetical protein